MKVKSESEVSQLCPTLRDPMDCSLPGSSVHGIFHARVLEWGAIAFSYMVFTEDLFKILKYSKYPIIEIRKIMCSYVTEDYKVIKSHVIEYFMTWNCLH